MIFPNTINERNVLFTSARDCRMGGMVGYEVREEHSIALDENPKKNEKMHT